MKEGKDARPFPSLEDLETSAKRLLTTRRQRDPSCCKTPIPDWAGAGLPLALTVALNHAGLDLDCSAVAACGGRAFGFGYAYVSPAFLVALG